MPAIRIAEFDTWRPGYGLATVSVIKAGTNVAASIYTDEDLTVAATNPQTLIERIVSGVSYGRFAVPLYTGEPYELLINSVDQTGVVRPPLYTLDDADASGALVTVDGGTEDISLADHLARRIDIRDFGAFLAVGEVGASASTNTATLTQALGTAGARGGGYVEIPSGTYQVISFTVPQGVIVRGAGRAATILQSTYAGHVATIGGDKAGFERISIDGVTLVALSVGVYAEAKDQIVFEDVEIKRFETGIYRKGGAESEWHGLFVSNCGTGYKAHGDLASGVGAAFSFNRWTGGQVDTCSVTGVEFKNVDAQCSHNTIRSVFFDTNTGTAVKIIGARTTALLDCHWEANTVDLDVADGVPVTADNTIIGLEIAGGSIDGGTATLAGHLEQVALRRIDLKDFTLTLTTPGSNILAEDCREISGVSIAGTATSWVRNKTGARGSAVGLTTGATATKAWAITLDAGQRVYLEAKVVGRQRNGADTGFYHVAVSAGRPGASLLYDSQTSNFTVGNTLTGATSGATARIAADSDSGATGTLTLQDIVGAFVDNEIITDGGAGSALTNGTLSFSAAALAGSVTAIRTAQETDANWEATFVANGPEIELRVTGAAAKTVEWTVFVEVVSS